jgi:hypothetical protein
VGPHRVTTLGAFRPLRLNNCKIKVLPHISGKKIKCLSSSVSVKTVNSVPKKKVKLSPKQAVEAYNVVRC